MGIEMNIKEELQEAYKKLDAAEMQISRMRKQANHDDKMLRILIAAGFLTQEKLEEARNILEGLPENN